ncbi:hypothetical protein D3C81_1844280 [compost metagenome]
MEGNDLIAVFAQNLAVIAAGQLNGGFVGLRSAVTEEHVVGAAVLHQHTGQLLLVLRIKQIAHMPQLVQLYGNLLCYLLGSMPQTGYSQTAHQIQILLALRVPQPAALPLDHSNGITGIRWKNGTFLIAHVTHSPFT